MEKEKQRKYWLKTMLTIADPVLTNLAAGTLRKNMPVVQYDADRSSYAHLEAFGRTMCGLTSWLEATGVSEEEHDLQKKYTALVLKCLEMSCDPSSPDYMNFHDGQQPLVDTAFLAHALIRARNVIVPSLTTDVKRNLIAGLKASRSITPGESNWILFSCMVEAALYLLGTDYDMLRIKYGLRQFMQWYKGDGIYGDGALLQVDYYNSFVIEPMLVDIAAIFAPIDKEIAELQPLILKRAQRYAQMLERLISPEGTYPIVGRSITYRFGAFHLLSQAALEHFLDKSMDPAQVRCALTAVIKRMLDHTDVFDENGWLRHGVYGYQPGLGENYICTGSLYLCCAVFLPLGLSPQDAFWNNPNCKWTSQRIVSGENFPKDCSIRD